MWDILFGSGGIRTIVLLKRLLAIESLLWLPTGRLCRFCHQPLKQGPNSPHTHAYFPGVPGKYIYCPSRVFSLYNAQGMEKEMTWPDFQQSDFYDAERDRWIADKRKP
ncbi:hypothetical protein KUCAC02_016981 [Chaenocephalus aceratus]|nr:hypothetical protein KUCAC02_016981 [Chaenocephalus aceratus]